MKDMFEEEIKFKINNYMEQIKVPKNLGGIVMEDFEKIKKEESQNITNENVEKTNVQESKETKNKKGKLLKISLGSVAAVVLVGVGIVAGTKIVGDKVITIDKNHVQNANFATDTKTIDEQKLESAIKEALIGLAKKETVSLKNNTNEYAEGHIILKSEIKDDTIYAYILARYGVYELKDNKPSIVSGSSTPITVIFKNGNSNKYELNKLIQPKDGSEYNSSLKEMFPEELIDSTKKLSNGTYEEEFNKQIMEYIKNLKNINTNINTNNNSNTENNATIKDISNYIGQWYSDEFSLEIKNVDKNKMSLSMSIYRLTGMEDIIATAIDDKTASFTGTNDYEENVSGTIEFDNNKITVIFNETNHIPQGTTYILTTKVNSSAVLTDEDESRIKEFLEKQENYAFLGLVYTEPEKLFDEYEFKPVRDTLNNILGYSYIHCPYSKPMTEEQYKIHQGSKYDPNNVIVGSHMIIKEEDLIKFFKEKTGVEYSKDILRKVFDFDENLNAYCVNRSDSFSGEVKIMSGYKINDDWHLRITGIEREPEHYIYNVILKENNGKYTFYACSNRTEKDYQIVKYLYEEKLKKYLDSTDPYEKLEKYSVYGIKFEPDIKLMLDNYKNVNGLFATVTYSVKPSAKEDESRWYAGNGKIDQYNEGWITDKSACVVVQKINGEYTITTDATGW